MPQSFSTKYIIINCINKITIFLFRNQISCPPSCVVNLSETKASHSHEIFYVFERLNPIIIVKDVSPATHIACEPCRGYSKNTNVITFDPKARFQMVKPSISAIFSLSSLTVIHTDNEHGAPRSFTHVSTSCIQIYL